MRDTLNIHNSYTKNEKIFLMYDLSSLKIGFLCGINTFITVKRFFFNDLSYFKIFKIAINKDNFSNNITGIVSQSKHFVRTLMKFSLSMSVYFYLSSNFIREAMMGYPNIVNSGFLFMLLQEIYFISNYHRYLYLTRLKSYDLDYHTFLKTLYRSPYFGYYLFMSAVLCLNYERVNFINTVLPLTAFGLYQYHFLIDNVIFDYKDKIQYQESNIKVFFYIKEKKFYMAFHFFNFLLPNALIMMMFSKSYSYDHKLNNWLV